MLDLLPSWPWAKFPGWVGWCHHTDSLFIEYVGLALNGCLEQRYHHRVHHLLNPTFLSRARDERILEYLWGPPQGQVLSVPGALPELDTCCP